MNGPRPRRIDPGLWGNPAFAALPTAARVLYIGLISCADPEGRLRADPRQLRVWIFPYNSLSPEEMQSYLEVLHGKGLIELYQVDGQQYAAHPHWSRHERTVLTKRPHGLPTTKRRGALTPGMGMEEEQAAAPGQVPVQAGPRSSRQRPRRLPGERRQRARQRTAMPRRPA